MASRAAKASAARRRVLDDDDDIEIEETAAVPQRQAAATSRSNGINRVQEASQMNPSDEDDVAESSGAASQKGSKKRKTREEDAIEIFGRDEDYSEVAEDEDAAAQVQSDVGVIESLHLVNFLCHGCVCRLVFQPFWLFSDAAQYLFIFRCNSFFSENFVEIWMLIYRPV